MASVERTLTHRRTGQRMTFGERWQTKRAAVYAALITGVLCLAGPAVVFGPMHDWARYPLAYTHRGDALANLWVIKTVVETGSWPPAPWAASLPCWNG